MIAYKLSYNILHQINYNNFMLAMHTRRDTYEISTLLEVINNSYYKFGLNNNFVQE